jgi:Fe-S-cluster-containing hydrogenase component 2
MNTGPRASAGFDLALTEMIGPDRHEFVVEIGSELGASVMEQMPCRNAVDRLLDSVEAAMAQAAARMGRSLENRGIKELLYRHYENKHWDEVAERCLSCGNCTMVCPTCFCSTVEDVTDLSGDHAERWRKWDSCFNADFSYIHGGAFGPPSVRDTANGWSQTRHMARSIWYVRLRGCGRCITWCPVGIDITQEAAAPRPGRSGHAGRGERIHETRDSYLRNIRL